MADKTKWYKLTSAKPGEATGVTAIILEGSYSEPKRGVALGQAGQFTEAEYEQYKGLFNLHEVDGEELKNTPLGPGHTLEEEKMGSGAKPQTSGQT